MSNQGFESPRLHTPWTGRGYGGGAGRINSRKKLARRAFFVICGSAMGDNAIIDGQFPFTDESALPAALRPFIATGDETPFDPSERNIYADLPRNTRRQIRRLEAIAAEREAAEAAFNEPLPEGAAEVLEDMHAKHVGRAKAQMAFNQSAIDVAHAAAAPVARADKATKLL